MYVRVPVALWGVVRSVNRLGGGPYIKSDTIVNKVEELTSYKTRLAEKLDNQPHNHCKHVLFTGAS